MAMYKNLLSEISTYFSISGEMIPQNGEDSYLYSFNENKGLVGVFDGCGGIGSRRYEILNGKTGSIYCFKNSWRMCSRVVWRNIPKRNILQIKVTDF